MTEGVIDQPVGTFLKKSPHHAFCHGDKDTTFLRERWSEMSKQPLFKDMIYTEDRNTLEEWVPIMMDGRPETQRVALTKMERAADLNFGALTKHLMAAYLKAGGDVKFEVDVSDVKPTVSRIGPYMSEGWELSYQPTFLLEPSMLTPDPLQLGQLIPQGFEAASKPMQKVSARKVFVGA